MLKNKTKKITRLLRKNKNEIKQTQKVVLSSCKEIDVQL
jgi:hypothetical protein